MNNNNGDTPIRWYLQRIGQVYASIINLKEGVNTIRRASKNSPPPKLTSRYISRNHCSFIVTNNEVRVQDHGSSNGTFVNERELLNAILTINENDKIGFGIQCNQDVSILEENIEFYVYTLKKDRNAPVFDISDDEDDVKNKSSKNGHNSDSSKTNYNSDQSQSGFPISITVDSDDERADNLAKSKSPIQTITVDDSEDEVNTSLDEILAQGPSKSTRDKYLGTSGIDNDLDIDLQESESSTELEENSPLNTSIPFFTISDDEDDGIDEYSMNMKYSQCILNDIKTESKEMDEAFEGDEMSDSVIYDQQNEEDDEENEEKTNRWLLKLSQSSKPSRSTNIEDPPDDIPCSSKSSIQKRKSVPPKETDSTDSIPAPKKFKNLNGNSIIKETSNDLRPSFIKALQSIEEQKLNKSKSPVSVESTFEKLKCEEEPVVKNGFISVISHENLEQCEPLLKVKPFIIVVQKLPCNLERFGCVAIEISPKLGSDKSNRNRKRKQSESSIGQVDAPLPKLSDAIDVPTINKEQAATITRRPDKIKERRKSMFEDTKKRIEEKRAHEKIDGKQKKPVKDADILKNGDSVHKSPESSNTVEKKPEKDRRKSPTEDDENKPQIKDDASKSKIIARRKSIIEDDKKKKIVARRKSIYAEATVPANDTSVPTAKPKILERRKSIFGTSNIPERRKSVADEKSNKEAPPLSKMPHIIEAPFMAKRRVGQKFAVNAKSKVNSKSRHHVKNGSVKEDLKAERMKRLKELANKTCESSKNTSEGKIATKPKVKVTLQSRSAFLIPGDFISASQQIDASDLARQIMAPPLSSYVIPKLIVKEDHPEDVQAAAVDELTMQKAKKLTFKAVAEISNITRKLPETNTTELDKCKKLNLDKPSSSIPAILAPQSTATTSSIASVSGRSIPSLTRIGGPTPAAASITPLTTALVPPRPVPFLARPGAPASSLSRPPAPPPPAYKQKVNYPSTSIPSTSRTCPNIKSILINRLNDKENKDTNRPTKKVCFVAIPEIFEFQIQSGNTMRVKTTSEIKDANNFLINSKEIDAKYNCLLNTITSWRPEWFTNEETIKKPPVNGVNHILLPMVEQYDSYESFERILMPILKLEFYHSIYSHSGMKTPLKFKINYIDCGRNSYNIKGGVEINGNHTINIGDITIIEFVQSNRKYQIFGYVTDRRTDKFTTEGCVFQNFGIHTAQTEISELLLKQCDDLKIRNLTYAKSDLNSFNGLFYLKFSDLLPNILDPLMNIAPQNMGLNSNYIGYDTLNELQGDILMNIYQQCLNRKQSNIILMEGPPGTGKSRVISNLIAQLYYGAEVAHNRQRILVCTRSNTAIDIIVQKLMLINKHTAKGYKQFKLIRFGMLNKMEPTVKPQSCEYLSKRIVEMVMKENRLKAQNPQYWTFYNEKQNLTKKMQVLIARTKNTPHSVVHDEIEVIRKRIMDLNVVLPPDIDDINEKSFEYKNLEKHIQNDLLRNADVVCTTLSSCNKLFASCKINFDVCIVDEATQCTEIYTLTPLQFGIKKMVLVGDVQQLPATVLSEECDKRGYGRSLFTRIQNAFSTSTTINPVHRLTEQYRMHPDICKWPNEYFYQGNLKSCVEDEPSFPFKPYTIFSLEYQQNLTQNDHQIYNVNEIDFVTDLVLQMDKICDTKEFSYGIITPYLRHKIELEKSIQTKLCSVNVSTIDAVQGQEKDIVIISTARTHGTGFLIHPQRLNVALTRAKKCLILCGNFALLKETPVWTSLLDDAKKRNILYHLGSNQDLSIENVMKCLKK